MRIDSRPVRFRLDANAKELLAAVEEWVELLAQEDYGAAYAFTEHSLNYADTPYRWTPDMIRELVYGYGMIEERNADNEVYKVTPIVTAQSHEGDTNRYCELTLAEEPYKHHHRAGVIVVGDIWYNLPLNGFWSDLTAAL